MFRFLCLHAGAGEAFSTQKYPSTHRPKAKVRLTGTQQAGWTHSHDALKAVYEDCLRLGVTFVFGAPGAAKSLIQTQSGMVSGIISEDGTHYYADKVILACGAWLDSIIDTKGQILAKWYCTIYQTGKTWSLLMNFSAPAGALSI